MSEVKKTSYQIFGRRAQTWEESSLEGGGTIALPVQWVSLYIIQPAVDLSNQPITSLNWLDKRPRVPHSIRHVGSIISALVCGFAEGSNHSAIFIKDKIIREEGTITNEITKTLVLPHIHLGVPVWTNGNWYSDIGLAIIRIRTPSVLAQFYGMEP